MRRLTAILMAALMVFALAACGQSSAPAAASAAVESGVEDGVLTIAMECAYAPYNWTQGDDSNGAVPIKDSDNEFANGYDVMMAKKICEANGWELEVIKADWDSLVPGVQSRTYDAVIAGQSMTAERSEQVDFAGPYLYASIVEGQPLCLRTGRQRPGGRFLHLAERHHLVRHHASADPQRQHPARCRERPCHADGSGNRHG